MELKNLNELKEVISEDEFHFLMNELIMNQNDFTEDEILQILEILAEKFCKFYRQIQLTEFEYSNLAIILTKLTDIGSLSRMINLCSLLISFEIDNYYEYLKRNLNNIKSGKIASEISETLNEYKTCR